MKIKKLSILAIVPLLASCGDSANEGPIKATEYNAAGEKQCVYTYKYNDDGKEIEELMEDVETSDIQKFEIFYKDGNIDYELESSLNKSTNEFNLNSKVFYTYENGLLVTSEQKIYEDGNFIPRIKNVMTYNSNKLEDTSEVYFYNREKNNYDLYERTKYEYNSNNQLTKITLNMSFTDGEPLLVSYREYSYYDDGKLKRIDDIDENNEMYSFELYSYDERQNTREDYVIEDGAPVLKVKFVTSYDKKGRMIRDDYYNISEETGLFVLDLYTIFEY